MKLAVIGSRTFEDYAQLVSELSGMQTSEIVLGAWGADKLSGRYAQEQAIPIKVFLPSYERFSKATLLRRNYQIIDYADKVVTF